MGKRHKIVKAVKANPMEFMYHNGEAMGAVVGSGGKVFSIRFRAPLSHHNLVASALEDTEEYRQIQSMKQMVKRRKLSSSRRLYW